MMTIHPLYDDGRLLTEQEAKAYAALLANQLPQFQVMSIMGKTEGTESVCITLETIGADDSVYLHTPHEVANFLNFLKMQQMLKEE